MSVIFEMLFFFQLSCITNWTYYNHSCYRFNKLTFTSHWNQSQYNCISLRSTAHLAVVTDAKERDFVLSIFPNDTFTLTYGTTAWIGATDYFGTEGVYEWVNGEPWTWGSTGWWPGEPVGGTLSDMKDCVSMKYIPNSTYSGKFTEDMCANPQPYICEYEL